MTLTIGLMNTQTTHATKIPKYYDEENNIQIAGKVSELLELKIVTFNASPMTFKNVEHFKNLFLLDQFYTWD